MRSTLTLDTGLSQNHQTVSAVLRRDPSTDGGKAMVAWNSFREVL